MRLAHVTGRVVATRKNGKLEGLTLLLVQPVDTCGQSDGLPLLAVDTVQAGCGDQVLVVQDGRSAMMALGRRGAPIDAAIVGIVDELDPVVIGAR